MENIKEFRYSYIIKKEARSRDSDKKNILCLIKYATLIFIMACFSTNGGGDILLKKAISAVVF